ncbi:matrix-remodeling-associated protein 7 isoform X1 [Chelonia mydas]|uniref:Matrix-remodeling-associated protein 7 n=1 Tax=Chelonia mydas TaxID=8469 RepID=M7AVH8_CHEMY|nr:matrix-remodeling-associated protein 7 isoform X1 [Chelonia mydas]EMP23768.1 Matrix-remodeling-associated protein 7 [Chelonia mydas]
MDVAVDLYLAVPLLFTVLAVILASVFVKLRAADGDKAAEPAKGEGSQGKEAGASAAAEPGQERKDGEGEGKEGDALKEEGIPRGEKGEEGAKDEGRRILVEEIGAEEGKAKRAAENEEPRPEEEAVGVAARTAKADQQGHPQEVNVPRQAAEAVEEEEEEEEEESKEEDQDWEKERLVVKEPELDDAADEQISFKYSPGKLRGNQYKTMMTKEELEEEQRVQREQLTAIFRLMKENSETFGEMTEGDMKEQLKLYDM